MNTQQQAEWQRLNYLKLMGIPCYTPRFELPNAKPSVVIPWPEQIALAAEPSPAMLTEPQTKSEAAATLKALKNAEQPTQLDDARPSRVETAELAQTETINKLNSAQHTTPEFSLSLFDLGELLLVDSAIPQREQQQAYQQLIGNLAFALGVDHFHAGAMAYSNFTWPLLQTGHFSQDETAAQQTVTAMMMKRLMKRDYKAVVLMGAAAQKYANGKVLADKTICLAPSLYGALQQPAFKPLIWQALQKLV